MVVGLIIAGVSAAVSLYSSYQSSQAASDEADRASAYASYNSDAQIAWGETQSAYTMMSAIFNANNILSQANYNIGLNNDAIEYNSDLLQTAQDYNDLLLSDQIDQTFEAAELEGLQLHQDYVKARGTSVGQQAASGTTIGEGSNKDVVIDMMSEEALYALVIDNNAQKAVASLQNARAQGAWETQVAIQKMQYEGQLSAASMLSSANSQAAASVFSGIVNASLQKEAAANAAAGIEISGAQTADNLNAQSDQYMTQGYMTAASYATKAYASGEFDSLLASDDDDLTTTYTGSVDHYGID